MERGEQGRGGEGGGFLIQLDVFCMCVGVCGRVFVVHLGLGHTHAQHSLWLSGLAAVGRWVECLRYRAVTVEMGGK